MATFSLRQAIGPSGNWIVVGARDDTHVEQQNGLNVSVGSFTEVLVYNVAATPISVTCELRGATGAILQSNVVEVPPRGIGRVVSGTCDRAAFYLRSTTPFLVHAEVRGTGGPPMQLPSYSLP